ncbi:hypothetical protein BHE74_00017759 [Ensete ventricosum]|uniref:WW domain-containing protein n=1 Tax=Ensete ventricosum TaxID=4639 RepID=A0A426YBV8_ENSVE|nr:hypothetical protein B296_00026401 [Ensete ventricosum]RWW74361.1 hypothetical protein BHE74_00017759 [Ensete ventricosum]
MTAPNIQMIAASLRSCSIGRSGRAHLLEASDESAGEVTVELNSDAMLPYQWEQRLDMRTGEVYYINLETGTKTSKDPRTAVVSAVTYSSSYITVKEISSSDDSCSRVGGSDDYESSVDTANSCLSSLSSSSPPDTVADPGESAQVLVAAGCRSCFMYFMVPKSVDACPKCGGGLLHLGRYGCV